MPGFGAPIPVLFYLDQKYVGEAELPPFFGGHRWCDRPQSHHYIDPIDGRVHASVEVLGEEWSTWMIPALDQKHPSLSRRRRGLQLDWLFGTGFYLDPSNLMLLPEPILQHEFRAALFNADHEVF